MPHPAVARGIIDVVVIVVAARGRGRWRHTGAMVKVIAFAVPVLRREVVGVRVGPGAPVVGRLVACPGPPAKRGDVHGCCCSWGYGGRGWIFRGWIREQMQ